MTSLFASEIPDLFLSHVQFRFTRRGMIFPYLSYFSAQKPISMAFCKFLIFLALSTSECWLLGKEIEGAGQEERYSFLQHLLSRLLWFSYRSGFEPIECPTSSLLDPFFLAVQTTL